MEIGSIPRWSVVTTGVIAMAARGFRKSRKETAGDRQAAAVALPEGGVFVCQECGTPIGLEQVVRTDAERVDGSVTGYVVIDHHCQCTAGEVRSSRMWGSFPAFVALFGRMPFLPYETPFARAQVATDDPSVTRWRWELEQVADFDEFLLFLDDARAHRPASGRADAQ